jgi:hypothetical protein
MDDTSFLYPYFEGGDAIFNEKALTAAIGGTESAAVRAYIGDDDNYLKDHPFYAGLFKAPATNALIKTVYGLFLFADNYHDFTDTARVDVKGLLLPTIDATVDAFYTRIIEYTVQPWFFAAYQAFDALVKRSKKGDRKEATIIRLFQTNGGQAIWEAAFPNNDMAKKLLQMFFVEKVFLGAVPAVRRIKMNDLAGVGDIGTDFFFEFELDKTGMTPSQRTTFARVFKTIMSAGAATEAQVDVTSDATSFPYRYTGKNEFIEHFTPHASAQTLWDGASMDTFEGRIIYDDTGELPLPAKSLQSVRSAQWKVAFSKGSGKKQSEYDVAMKYTRPGPVPAPLTRAYKLSMATKGFTVAHMFEHAAYLKYALDYIRLGRADKDALAPAAAAIVEAAKPLLRAHIEKIYARLVVAASAKKTRNLQLPPLITLEQLRTPGLVSVDDLRSLLIIPIDGKGSCDADQAIYASYRNYGFTTLDALCYFSGILNRANTAYVVSASGRISAARFIKDTEKLEGKKTELEINRVALKFKELINLYVSAGTYMNGLIAAHAVLFNNTGIKYGANPGAPGLVGDVLRLYFVNKVVASAAEIRRLMEAEFIIAKIVTLVRYLTESAGATPAGAMFRVGENIDVALNSMFNAMQRANTFGQVLVGTAYDIYTRFVDTASTGDVARAKPQGQATYADLYGDMYTAIEKYIARFKGMVTYKKTGTAVALDTFTLVEMNRQAKKDATVAVTVNGDMQYYKVIDPIGQFSVIDTIDDVILPALCELYRTGEAALTRKGAQTCNKVVNELNDLFDLGIPVVDAGEVAADVAGRLEDAVGAAIEGRKKEYEALLSERGQARSLARVQAGGRALGLSLREKTKTRRRARLTVEAKLARTFERGSPRKGNKMDYLIHRVLQNPVKVIRGLGLPRTVYDGAPTEGILLFILSLVILEDVGTVTAEGGATVKATTLRATRRASRQRATVQRTRRTRTRTLAQSAAMAEMYGPVIDIIQRARHQLSYTVNQYIYDEDRSQQPTELHSAAIYIIEDMYDSLTNSDQIPFVKQMYPQGDRGLKYIREVARDIASLPGTPRQFSQAQLYDLQDVSGAAPMTTSAFRTAYITHLKGLETLLLSIKYEIEVTGSVEELV